MPATNKILHDPRYRADGIFCEAPKRIDPSVAVDGAAATGEQASQSRWNTNDYHWEERDVLDFARREASALLLDDAAARVLWRDQNGGELVVASVALEGDCASNVRKGRRILTYALTLTLTCRGRRGGAAMDATLTTREFCHDDAEATVAVDLATTPLDSEAGCDVQRAMQAHEMFTKVLKKKGLPRVEAAVRALRRRLVEAKGQAPDVDGEAPGAR